MRIRSAAMCLLFIVVGCSQTTMPSVSPYVSKITAPHSSSGAGYRILHNFEALTDIGVQPNGVVAVNGTLYGTTNAGAASDLGAIYKIPLSGGKATAMHSLFTRGKGNPAAGLIAVDGVFYGTTSSNCGSVFSVTAAGVFKTLHHFGYTDGCAPTSALTNVGGTLYGTTSEGGKFAQVGHYSSGGTVFRIDRDGQNFRVLHSFRGPDGTLPDASLINVNGTLYGTTMTGGSTKPNWLGSGVVYSVTPAGVEHTVYAFPKYPGSGGSGENPRAPLIHVDGTLYGTTASGGAYGYGTLFSVTASGELKILHSFGNGSDGRAPRGPLLNIRGVLYGTTGSGGNSSTCPYVSDYGGCGTAFKITTSGRETVLHNFAGLNDGAIPVSGMIDISGVLYGAASEGGSRGAGTLFELTP